VLFRSGVVPPDSHGIPRVPWYSGAAFRVPLSLRLRGFHALWRTFPGPSARLAVPPGRPPPPDKTVPRPRTGNAGGLSRPCGLGSSPFAHRYLGNRGCFLFLGVLRCFTSPGSPQGRSLAARAHHAGGLPHSDIPGPTPACGPPGHIGAGPVLHRPEGAYASTAGLTLLDRKDASYPVQLSRC